MILYLPSNCQRVVAADSIRITTWGGGANGARQGATGYVRREKRRSRVPLRAADGRRAQAPAPLHDATTGPGGVRALEEVRKVGLVTPARERVVIHARSDHVHDVRDPLLPERHDLLGALDAADVQAIEDFVDARRVPRRLRRPVLRLHRSGWASARRAPADR